MYVQLASAYGWTFDQIAEMSPYQQRAALTGKLDEQGRKTMEFATEAQYLKWMAEHGTR